MYHFLKSENLPPLLLCNKLVLHDGNGKPSSNEQNNDVCLKKKIGPYELFLGF